MAIHNGKQITPPLNPHFIKLIRETRGHVRSFAQANRSWDSKGKHWIYKLMQIGFCAYVCVRGCFSLYFFLLFRYETKRMEIEKWLQRMESRLEQMGKIATTADVLEAQQKEQKVNTILTTTTTTKRSRKTCT